MSAVTRSTTIDSPLAATISLAEIAEALVRVVRADHPDQQTITLLAISVTQLVRDPVLQLELPLGLVDEACRSGSRQGRARLTADHAVDRIRNRFGRAAIGYGEVRRESRDDVPDAFRALAEKPL
jgi:DNA polymerase-4